ncbi:sex-determining region Y protein [Drosophila ficusphila]|uniref:sex-determining region Y protein n=1 Tax=Drosophila ficusphila TaxID=30025 RepID=UPI0007E78152|nr:sex-determining region Y protein [Drosophila ficusphila]
MSVEDREQLRRFVDVNRRRLKAILKRLHWSEKGVMAAREGGQSSKNHAKEEDVLGAKELLPDSCCTNSAFSIQLDRTAIQRIIGKDTGQLNEAATFDDLQSGLNANERLLVYEHVLQHTKKHPEFEDNAAFAEMVSVTKRERKKQRRHRKSKPTINEELQQLVNLQMHALQMQWQKEHDEQHQEYEKHTHKHEGHKERHQTPKEHKECHPKRHNELKERYQDHKEDTERYRDHKDLHPVEMNIKEGHEKHKERHRDHRSSRKRSRNRSPSSERMRYGQKRDDHEYRRQYYRKH